MKTSESGKDFIKRFESISLKPYLDIIGVPTIGYGNTYYEDGKKVTIHDKPITLKKANDLFDFILSKDFEIPVNKLLKKNISQNQFDAIISLAYNIGISNFKSSTLLRKINENPDDKTIHLEFLKWNKSGGKVVNGLTRRRMEESLVFNKKNA